MFWQVNRPQLRNRDAGSMRRTFRGIYCRYVGRDEYVGREAGRQFGMGVRMTGTLLVALGAICLLAALMMLIFTVLRSDQSAARIGGIFWIAGPIMILCGRRIRRL